MARIILVSDDIVKQWEKQGKNEFIKMCKESLDGYTSNKGAYEQVVKEFPDIKKLIYELCWAGVEGKLKPDQIVGTFADISTFYLEAPLLIADLLAVLEVELSCYEDAEDKKRFTNLVLASLTAVPECLLKERLDSEVLENIGLLQSKAVFQQKYVKTKTKIYYKQQKFNLLREETEGYSKLITELSQDFPSDFSHSSVLNHIQSLIGCFNLDPNRVLDIILDVFECRPNKSFIFVPLLSNYAMDRTTLCHILGFKYHFYQRTADVITKPSLYHLTALLLQHNLISLETLLPHLIPLESEMVERYKKDLSEAKLYCQKLTTTLLSEKGTCTNNENKDEKVEPSQEDRNNQKLGLCEALLDVGCHEHALAIISSIPQFSALSYPLLAQSLCRLIHYIIDPLYQKHSSLPVELLKHRRTPNSYSSSTKQAKSFDDLLRTAFPLINQLGPYLSSDPVLLAKINRLAKTYMAQINNNPYRDGMISDIFCQFMMVYDECILPSLSLLSGNCCVSEEVWGFVKLLKYEHRYRLYGQWKNESYLRIPILMRAHAEVLSRTKYIMKRLVKENVKPVGRQIGKLSHKAPGVIFEQILSQIQRYDNFIIPVVDSMKFITSLSYDVLAYCVIEALASPDKERLKTDGSNISTWLQSLANFSGSVLKKYQIDISGLLHYIINQLKAGRSCDLYVLREVIQKMAGIEVSEEVTNDQLMSLGGGELLKQEAGYFTQVRNTKKSSSRLMDCLNDQNLTIPLCFLMSQQRNAIVFPAPELAGAIEEDNRHVKLVGKLYDQCQDTMVQFISFLLMQMTSDELKKKLPNLLELSRDYFISPDVAFALWRGIFKDNIIAKAEELRKSEKKDKTAVSNSQNNKMLRYYEAVESVLQPLRKDLIEPMMPPKLREELNLHFYSSFWLLELYDLEVPTLAYANQIKIHQAQQQAIDDNKDLAQSKKKKEKERCQSLIEKLNEEEKKQEEHVKMVLSRLKQEKEQWFSPKLAKHSTISAILQCCIFPRCCFTAVDAIFCSKFIYILHNLKTPNFSSLICYDRIFNDITWLVSSCTENEAHRYGRFLCAVLTDVMSWHSDKNIYDKECANFPGFVTVFRSPLNNQNVVADHLDYENYRHVVHKWHYGLTKSAVNCLDSGDYIQIRNMLIVLTRIIPHYPKVHKFGIAVERRVDKVIETEKEKRQDLYHLAYGFCNQLKSTKKTWVQDHLFHKKEPENKTKPTSSVSQSNDANVNAPSIKAEEGKVVDSKPVLKQQSLKPRTSLTEEEDKSNVAGKPGDQLNAAVKQQTVQSSRPVSKSSREKIKVDSERRNNVEQVEPKESSSNSSSASGDKRDDRGSLEQQRSAESSPLARKVRVGEHAVKVRDSNSDWMGEHGHQMQQQDDSNSFNESSDASHHRGSSKQSVSDERDVKRRKVESSAGAKESISHCDNKERSRRSPNYEERDKRNAIGEKKAEGSRERFERKRHSGPFLEPDRSDGLDVREVKRHKLDDSSSSARETLNKINGNDDRKRESRSKDRKEELDKFKLTGKDDEMTKESKMDSFKERAKEHRLKKESADKEKRLPSDKHPKKPKAR